MMLEKRSIRGRREMAIIASLDAVLLTNAVVLLLVALDNFQGLVFFLLSLHLLHIFTILTSYVIVRHATTSLDALRILLLVYFVMMIIDTIILLCQVLLLGHADDDEAVAKHQHVAAFVRLGLALSFVLIDIGGAVFTNVAQNTAVRLHYSNNDLFDIADDAMGQVYHSHQSASASSGTGK